MNESSTKGPLSNFEEINSNETEDKLKELDNFLKCPICYEYFNTCVVTDCSHNFCSLCIRKYILFKTECPTCFTQLYDSQLRPNRIVDTFVSIMPDLKDRLIRRIRTLKTLKPNTLYVSPRKGTDSTPVTKHNVKKRRILTDNKDKTPENEPTAVFVEPETSNTPKLSKSTPKVTIPPIFQSPVKKTPSTTPKNTAAPTVQCPICTIDIPERNINVHLDKCLERQQHSPERRNPNEADRRAHLPKLVLRLMSTTALRAKAKEYGLSAHGDNETLKNRIQRYTVLYNAECDKVDPRPVTEIIRLLEKEEKALSQKLPKSIFSVPDNGNSKEELASQYLKENKNYFDKLIKNVRDRKTDEKLSTSPDVARTNVKHSKTRVPDPTYYGPSTSNYVPKVYSYCDPENQIDVEEIKIEPAIDIEEGVERNDESDDNISEELFPIPRKRQRIFEESECNDDVVKNEVQFVPVNVEDESNDPVFDALTDEDDDVDNAKSSDDVSFKLDESPVFRRRPRRKRRSEDVEPTNIRKSLRKKKKR